MTQGVPLFYLCLIAFQNISIADQSHTAKLGGLFNAALGEAGLGEQVIVYLTV